MLVGASPVWFATLFGLCRFNGGFSKEQRLAEQHFTTIDFPGASGAGAFGINARGDIVGDYNQDQDGFLLSKGKFTSIDFPSASATAARGINSEGEIVGLYCLQGPVPTLCNGTGLHGFLLSNGAFTTVDFPVHRTRRHMGLTPKVTS